VIGGSWTTTGTDHATIPSLTTDNLRKPTSAIAVPILQIT
jgi:hypothetical protein